MHRCRLYIKEQESQSILRRSGRIGLIVDPYIVINGKFVSCQSRIKNTLLIFLRGKNE